MARDCQTCIHPDRERIEVELALSPSVREVSERFDIPRRSLSSHRQKHMTAQQIVRLRAITPAQAEVSIQELTAKGGEAAVLGFSRLIQECKDVADKCDATERFEIGAKYRKLQLEAYKEQAKIACIYPGRSTVNNNLVFGDVAHVFDMLDAILRPFPEARNAVALAFSQSQQQVLEHKP